MNSILLWAVLFLLFLNGCCTLSLELDFRRIRRHNQAEQAARLKAEQAIQLAPQPPKRSAGMNRKVKGFQLVNYDLSIPGWMTEPELEWLYQTATRMNSIVEIGCYQGRSTLALLKGCKGPVYAVDTWQDIMSDGTDNLLEFLRNLDKRLTASEFGRLRPWKIPSALAAPYIPPVDMMFIDGDHVYPGVIADIQAYGPKAITLLCGHDFKNPDWPDVERAVMEQFGPRVQNPVGLIWSVEI